MPWIRRCGSTASGRGRLPWWWARTTSRRWCWRSSTRRTFAGARCGSTRRGDSPGVWVEVPEGCSASRPAKLRPGLVIHLPEDGAYRESPESRAFPGWRAAEVHTAMNEASTSARPARCSGASPARSANGTAPDRTTPRGSARSVRRCAPHPGRKDTPRGGTRDTPRGAPGSWKRSRAGFRPPEGLPEAAPARRGGLAGRHRRGRRRHSPSERGRGGPPHTDRAAAPLRLTGGGNLSRAGILLPR